MLNYTDEEVIQKVLSDVSVTYDIEHEHLRKIGTIHKTEGEIRYAAGNLVEKVLQSIFDSINSFLGDEKIISKVGGSDYLKKKN